MRRKPGLVLWLIAMWVTMGLVTKDYVNAQCKRNVCNAIQCRLVSNGFTCYYDTLIDCQNCDSNARNCLDTGITADHCLVNSNHATYKEYNVEGFVRWYLKQIAAKEK